MDIKQQLHGLIHLQEIDTRLQELAEAREELRRAILEVRDPLTRLETERDDLAGRLDTLAREIRAREGDLQQTQERIQRSRDKLPQITTQKEYFALQKEIETMEREREALEADLLQKMGETEELQRSLEETRGRCAAEEKAFLEKKKAMEAEHADTGAEEERLKAEREAVCREIDPVHLELYDKVLSHRGSPAVVRIVDGNCQGCYMSLPPQLSHDVRKENAIITCSFCQRILYVEE